MTAPAPRTGFVFVVRYTTANGTQLSRFYRNGSAARRFADWLAARGKPCRVYRAEVDHWTEGLPELTSRTNRRRTTSTKEHTA